MVSSNFSIKFKTLVKLFLSGRRGGVYYYEEDLEHEDFKILLIFVFFVLFVV